MRGIIGGRFVCGVEGGWKGLGGVGVWRRIEDWRGIERETNDCMIEIVRD